MYGDDYLVAAGLYVVGIGWRTAKSYTWEETKAHKKKGRVRSLILAGSLVVLAVSASWIAHREGLHQAKLIRTPQPTASIPIPAQPQAGEGLSALPKSPGVHPKSDKPEVTLHSPTGKHLEQDDAITHTIVDVISGTLRVNRARVVPNARLTEDLGADYLDKQELEMGIEGAFDIHIQASDWIKVRTVKDVNEYVRAHFKSTTNTTN